MTHPCTIRPVSAADLDLVCRHRAAMFRDAGTPEADLVAMAAPFRHWLAPRLADGRYAGFVADDGGRPVAGVGLMALDWPPHPAHPTDGRRGYVLNLYVEPTHRMRGIARALLAAAEAECARRGLGYLVLHATAAGRPLYAQGGWAPTPEMAKVLPALPRDGA